MDRYTIDYGIDLGTTNSAICRLEKGVPTIIRSDSGMETMPSCVSFKKNGAVSVGFAAYSDLGHSKLRALKKGSALSSNSCIEFKRSMGSDTTFANSYADHIWTPEELSAQVLKTLCSFVTDEDVKAAVITVPAKFTVNQKDATLQAAHLAGLEQVELLQEPIAASMAYGLTADDRDGIWMVFDFGGGTLDVALVHVSDGIMQVFDTEGDNYLGGKNLDEAVVAKILLPELLSRYVFDLSDTDRITLLTEALKVEAEKVKNALSYKELVTVEIEAGDWGEDADGEEIEMDITVTRQQLNDAIRPILQKAVDVCTAIMARNNISPERLTHLIPIGGPTNIPLLRDMLREQVTPNVDTGIDPMTAVARGAALYAATLPLKNYVGTMANGNAIQLDIDFDATTVDPETYVVVRTASPVEGLTVKFIRTADRHESPEAAVAEKGALIIAELLPGRPNTFAVSASVNGAATPCFPSELTIIQGTKAGSAILPYNIGIEVFNPKREQCVFTAMTGLEKNRPLPASGSVYGLKTMSDIFAGDENAKIRIAIYQGDSNAEGKTAALFEYVSDVEVGGDDIATFIPKGSHVNVLIDVDRSEMMTVTCEFPSTSQTVQKRLDTSRRQESKTADYLREILSRAREQVLRIANSAIATDQILTMQERLRLAEESLTAGGQPRQIEQHIKEVLRDIEAFETASEWDRQSNSLMKALHALQIEGLKRKEDAGITRMIESFATRVEVMLEFRDGRRAKFLQHEIEEYNYAIRQEEIYRNVIRWADANFSSIHWTDPKLAQKLVMKAAEVLRKDPNAPLSATKEVTEAFYALIIRSEDMADDDGDDTVHAITPNILSM